MTSRFALVVGLLGPLTLVAAPLHAAPAPTSEATKGAVVAMEVHQAARFLSSVYRAQVVVLGGSDQPIPVALDGLAAEAAFQRLADEAGLGFQRSDNTFVLLPAELKPRVDGARRAQGKIVDLDFVLVDADKIVGLLRDILHLTVEGHVGGRMSVYGKGFNSLSLLGLITRLAGKEANPKSGKVIVGEALPAAPEGSAPSCPQSTEPIVVQLGCHEVSTMEMVAWVNRGDHSFAAVRASSSTSARPIIALVRKGEALGKGNARVESIDATGISLSGGVQVPAAQPAPSFTKVKLEVTKLGSNLAVIEGMGGNIGVSFGDDGLLVVDDEFGPLNAKLRAALDTLSHGAVRIVFNTHWHGDHTGGNGPLAGQGALIVAQDNARRRMTVQQLNTLFHRMTSPAPHQALPVMTFDEEMTFHVNDEDILVFHVPHAHTDGDAIVWFRKANVVHTGDTCFSGGYPVIDGDSGGTIDGYIAAVNRVLKIADDGTRIIPGHGSITERKKVKEWRDMLATARGRIGKLKAQRKTLEQVIAEKPTADFDATWGKGFVPPAMFITMVYRTIDGPMASSGMPGMAPGPAPGAAPKK